jgi:hypothetical protein
MTKYAYAGPPFNFLGNFTETQKGKLNSWVNSRLGNANDIQKHHQIRAQQLRKTAGILEEYYSSKHIENLAPTFSKDSWKPGTDGHFDYVLRDDHIPMVKVSELKRYFKEQLNLQDDAVFMMNHVRNIIEKHEDSAQVASETSDTVAILLKDIDNLFSQPQYQATLVQDISDTYKGQSRFRAHPLDEPTAWEKDVANRTVEV